MNLIPAKKPLLLRERHLSQLRRTFPLPYRLRDRSPSMESNPSGPVGVGHFSALVTVKGGKVKVSVYPRFRDCGSTRELRCRWEGFTLNEVITPCSSSLIWQGTYGSSRGTGIPTVNGTLRIVHGYHVVSNVKKVSHDLPTIRLDKSHMWWRDRGLNPFISFKVITCQR